jgi:hypothetical protein
MTFKNTAFTCSSVIMRRLSVSYRKMCRVGHQLRSRNVNGKQLLILVNFVSMKIFLISKQLHFCNFGIILFYISLPSLSNLNKLCTMVDIKRFSGFGVGH